MGDGLRTIRVVTTDESLLANARAAASAIDGWEIAQALSVAEILEHMPPPGDVILIDTWLRGANVYEGCKRLAGNTRCRTYVVTEHGNRLAEPIARFCGATGVIERPISTSRLRSALDQAAGARPPLPRDGRGQGNEDAMLPERLLADIAGKPDESLVAALVDPETSLFNYAFLNYKIDEEFKRAKRFSAPLSCVMLGSEGQVGADTLRELAAIFLDASRDTDVLGRFDETSFLFLLPNTGPDGAKTMAKRVGELTKERRLADLVGDPIVISVGISTFPHPEVRRKGDLFAKARAAFNDARLKGGGVVCAS
ncbi:MAG TPA: diguanylate cyclase [Planctomycetota bacterium]|jgi:diguanylate cyclase (GGDEF)-like protein|nr:diguanylate cyclase [Planctomycetota bacterium]